MIKRRCQPRIAVAARDDFRVWPDLKTDVLERLAILRCSAACEENSRAIDLLRELGKNTPQTLGRSEPEVRCRQFALLENAKFPTGITGTSYGLNQQPGSFRATTFDPENAFTWVHNRLSLTAPARF